MIRTLDVVQSPETDDEGDDDQLALLGRFEEAVVLAAMACGPEATAGAIKARLSPLIGKRHINAVLTTLDRLARKGIIETIGKAARDGLSGRKCKTYQVTRIGHERVDRGVNIVAELAREAGLKRAA